MTDTHSGEFMFPLLTSRLVIRPFANDDIPQFVEAVLESVNTVGRWLPWCTSTYSTTEATDWFTFCDQSRQAHTAVDLDIFDRTSERFLGGISINEIQPIRQMGNIGYWVRQSMQGKSIALEAVNSIAVYGFSQLKLTRLEIVTGEENGASRRVAEKAGAHYEGIARNRIIIRQQPIDAALYSLVPANSLHAR
ncbi:GNAT family N-acetyltransferase [Prodigiosinella confusarubida]|nr:GNAT family protein [Serratia sp. ATCC 39006]